MAIESALVLVGEEDDSTVDDFAKILAGKDVPFRRTQGIVGAVAAAAAWKKEHAKNGRMTTVDFIGHAVQGRFFFGGGEVLSSCPEVYSRLGQLRALIDRPDDAETNIEWGLRLIGCDVSNQDYGSNRYPTQNGTVLQVALTWFLQLPVWAPTGPILGKHFDNADNRVPYSLLESASLSRAVRIPEHLTPELRARRNRAALADVLTGLPVVSTEALAGGRLEDFDFTAPRDASELFGDISQGEELRVLPLLSPDIARAWLLFDQTVILAERKNGQRVAYLKR